MTKKLVILFSFFSFTLYFVGFESQFVAYTSCVCSGKSSGYCIGTASNNSFGKLFAAAPVNQQWIINVDQGSGTVEFKAIGRPSMLKINGKGSSPRGSITVDGDKASGMLSFDLDSLDTGIKLRNQHMKEKYLETSKFAKATYTIKNFIVSGVLKSENARLEKVPFEGTLSLHNVEKNISGLAQIERNGNEVSVNAEFGIKISDFAIPTPGYAGITMAEDVNIFVQFKAPTKTLTSAQ